MRVVFADASEACWTPVYEVRVSISRRFLLSIVAVCRASVILLVCSTKEKSVCGRREKSVCERTSSMFDTCVCIEHIDMCDKFCMIMHRLTRKTRASETQGLETVFWYGVLAALPRLLGQSTNYCTSKKLPI